MRFLVFTMVVLIGLSAKSQDLSSPEATFRTLMISIQTEDINLYKSCWVEDRTEKEGLLNALIDNPSKWQQLKSKFNGPQELTDVDFLDKKTGSWFIANITAIESESNPIGTISMILINDQWKMYSW